MGGKAGSKLRANTEKPKLAVMTDAHRLKIANSNVLSRLIKHAGGEVEMKPTEVTAAIALMRKFLPDLANVEVTTGEGGLHVHLHSDAKKV